MRHICRRLMVRSKCDLKIFVSLVLPASFVAFTSVPVQGATAQDSTVSLPARLFHDTLAIEVRVGADSHTAVVDSGAPWAALDPGAFRSVAAMSAPTEELSLGIGTLPPVKTKYQTMKVCGNACDLMPGGAIPARAFAPALVTLDYPNRTVTIRPAPRARDTPSALRIPARLAGGSETPVSIRPSRLLVSLVVEGRKLTALVDTGASLLVVRSAIFEQLVADGRATLEVNSISGVGSAKARITRSRAVRLGSDTSVHVPVQAAPNSDSFLDGVSAEAGTRVDALIGGSLLRNYVVTLDYRTPQLLVTRSATPDPLSDQYQRVRVAIRPAEDGSNYVVDRALTSAGQPADSEKMQDVVGGTLVSVDQRIVAGLDHEQADRLLRGRTGDVRTLRITPVTGGQDLVVSLPVVQLLPFDETAD